MKNNLKIIFRFFVTTILILYLLIKIDLQKLWVIFSNMNIFLFFLASFLYLLSSVISTIRWRLFVPLNSSLSLKKLFSLYMIGSFFNIFLPGIMGGDLVKIIILRKAIGLKDAIGSVFIERYIGLFALLLLGFSFFFIYKKLMTENWTLYFVPISFFLLFLGTFLLFLSDKFSFISNLKKYVFSFKKGVFFKAFFYSLLIQLVVIVSVYFVFIGVEAPIKFYEVVIYLPLVIILTMLPISISGIGVREWSFLFFFGNSIGNEKALAVSIIWFFSIAFASLIGGIEYLRFKDFFNIDKE